VVVDKEKSAQVKGASKHRHRVRLMGKKGGKMAWSGGCLMSEDRHGPRE